MFAKVETDSGEIINVQYPGGRFGGAAILSFLTGLSLYCAQDDLSELHWFSELEPYAKENLCSLGLPLIESFYSSPEWKDFREDEYAFFLHRYPDALIGKDEFENTVRQISKKWVDIRYLLAGVNNLIQVLQATNLQASSWYDPSVTIPDFQMLQQALVFLAERGAEKARIQFV